MINKLYRLTENIGRTTNSLRRLKSYSILILVFLIVSCNGQNQKKPNTSKLNTTSSEQLKNKASKVINPKNGFSCGFLDSNGNLWFGSNGGGVYHYNGNYFENFTEDNGLCNNQVYSIIEDKESKVWFGTQNGLCSYDRKIFKHVPLPFRDTSSAFLDKVYPVINPNAVYSIAQDKKGDIWLGTGGGAYRYDGKSFTPYLTEIGTKQEDSLYHNWVTSIQEDTAGNIWFASMTHGGVSRYDGENFTQFMPQDGLSDDMVRVIFNDKSGNIWFGFNGNRNSGLTVYKGNSFKTFSEEDGLCNKSIIAIYEDKNAQLWLGSGRGNLCIFNGKSFSEFTTKEGQRFEIIQFIIGDANENIWFGGESGLWKFDGESVLNMTK